MEGFTTVQTIAAQWGVTPAAVYDMCKAGKIDGAVKNKGRWYVPNNATRPLDARVRDGKYQKVTPLPLPLGISDYKTASSKYYYIDKTLMIKEFLDERPQVSLFTRPRRFGKTLNMDMLRVFFERSPEDTSIYFKDKAIWRCGADYQSHQGMYPVIFVTFKDIKCENWEDTYQKLSNIFQSEFVRHAELSDSASCTELDRNYYRMAVQGQLSPVELSDAFLVLTRMLHQHSGVAPIIIIDEYDTPIQQGYMLGFYDQVILFMRNLFSAGLKDNPHLTFGFLTGILRVAKESIFSGMNNLAINSVLEDKYSKYFGFTAHEVVQILDYYGARNHLREVQNWYDGYRFGETDIYNPWSIINYIRNGCKVGAYWQSTGSTEIIREVLAEAGSSIYEDLRTIVEGRPIPAYIDTGVIYPEIRNNPYSVYSFLLVSGYLKAVRSNETFADGMMCDVMIPNKEISLVYRKEVLSLLDGIIPSSTAFSIQKSLYSGDFELLRYSLRKLLLHSASTFDTANESFYHGLVLGICLLMDSAYYVSSNREAGEGRYDIQLMPKKAGVPGIVIEMKAAKNASESKLKALADEAVEQIKNNLYYTDLILSKAETVYLYGVARSGKQVQIAMETYKSKE